MWNSFDRSAVTDFAEIIESDDFWSNVATCLSVLDVITKELDVMEADTTTIDQVYSSFNKMLKHFQHVENIRDLVKERWDFLTTESMQFAYMLNPLNNLADMVDNDRHDTYQRLSAYVLRNAAQLGKIKESDPCKAYDLRKNFATEFMNQVDSFLVWSNSKF